MPEFWAQIDDHRVFVTAVLERTVVYVDGSERRLTKRENCFVDPDDIELRAVTTSISWRSRGKAIAAQAAAAEPAEPTPDMLAAESAAAEAEGDGEGDDGPAEETEETHPL
jgi:hypothetical protein